MSRNSIINNINAEINTNGIQYITGEVLNSILVQLSNNILFLDDENVITDEFRLVNGLEQTYYFSDGLGISTQDGDFVAVSLDRFVSDINGNVLELSRDRLQFNQAKIKVNPNEETNVNIPITGVNERNLSVGVKLNNQTYYSGSNGVIDLGTIGFPENTYVPIVGDTLIQSVKTFANSPIVPIATLPSQAVNLGQVNEILLNGDFLNKHTENVITDGFSIKSGDFNFIFQNDGYLSVSDNNNNYYELYPNGIGFNEVNINIDTSQQSNLKIPTVGETERNLSVGTRINGVDRYAGNNGIVDLNDVITENDLDGFIYDVDYNSTNHQLTFYQKNEPNIVVDLPIEQLIKGVELVGDDLVFTFENGDTTTVPMNTLLVGVVKSVNGKNPNSQGEVVLNIADIPNLSSTLDGKANVNDSRINNGQSAYNAIGFPLNNLSTTYKTDLVGAINEVNSNVSKRVSYIITQGVNWYRIAKGLTNGGEGCSFILFVQRSYGNINNESYTFSINTAHSGKTTITQLSGTYNTQILTHLRVVNTIEDGINVDIRYNHHLSNRLYVRVIGSGEAIPAIIAPEVTTGVTELVIVNGMAVLGNGNSSQWNQAYGWGNHANAGYALISQVYTQSQALATFVPINGASTINGTKTFSSSPVVPNGTLSSHAVNLGQLGNYSNTRLSNLVSDLSTSEQNTIKSKLGILKDEVIVLNAGNTVTVNKFKTTIIADFSGTQGVELNLSDEALIDGSEIKIVTRNCVVDLKSNKIMNNGVNIPIGNAIKVQHHEEAILTYNSVNSTLYARKFKQDITW